MQIGYWNLIPVSSLGSKGVKSTRKREEEKVTVKESIQEKFVEMKDASFYTESAKEGPAW